MSIDLNSRLGNYVGVTTIAHRTVEGTKYLTALYGAYNAMGLIGSECNGIVVLDDTNRQVVLDEHCKTGSGWCGPTRAQWKEFGRIAALDDDAFVEFCLNHSRYRGVLA